MKCRLKKDESIIINPVLLRGCRGIPSALSVCFLLRGAEFTELGIPTSLPTSSFCVWEDMCYIKEPIFTTSITVCTMERHEAGQQEALVEVRVGTDSSEAIHLPRGSPADRPGCLKCAVALATMMGFVIVALVAGFILHLFMFTPSCNQVRNTTWH